MQIRITTLNARDGKWPGECLLALDNPEMYCCIGCNGLTFGLTKENMLNLEYASEVTDVYPELRDTVRCDLYEKAWETIASKELLDRIENEMGFFLGANVPLQHVASYLNDTVATGYPDKGYPDSGDPDTAVKYLRLVFKEAGLAINEDWQIRYYPKKP